MTATQVLRAAFVRTAGARDRIYVTRTDGSEVSWSFPTYGDALPHDLVHLIVESCFGLSSGFWGRVDRGADPERIAAEANRIGGKDKYAGFGADRTELLRAEALANAPWWRDGTTLEEIEQAVGEQCRQLGVAVPDRFLERAASARGMLARMNERWRALGSKGTLDVTFRTDRPEDSQIELAGREAERSQIADQRTPR